MNTEELFEKLGIEQGYITNAHSTVYRAMNRVACKVVAYEYSAFGLVWVQKNDKGKKLMAFATRNRGWEHHGYGYMTGRLDKVEKIVTMFKFPVIIEKRLWNELREGVVVDAI